MHVFKLTVKNYVSSANGFPFVDFAKLRLCEFFWLCVFPRAIVVLRFQLVNGLDVPRYMSETEVMVDVNVSPTADVMEYTTTTSSSNHTSKNANGNIITLTLKNNHLIVETEERAVRIITSDANL